MHAKWKGQQLLELKGKIGKAQKGLQIKERKREKNSIREKTLIEKPRGPSPVVALGKNKKKTKRGAYKERRKTVRIWGEKRKLPKRVGPGSGFIYKDIVGRGEKEGDGMDQKEKGKIA